MNQVKYGQVWELRDKNGKVHVARVHRVAQAEFVSARRVYLQCVRTGRVYNRAMKLLRDGSLGGNTARMLKEAPAGLVEPPFHCGMMRNDPKPGKRVRGTMTLPPRDLIDRVRNVVRCHGPAGAQNRLRVNITTLERVLVPQRVRQDTIDRIRMKLDEFEAKQCVG